MPFKSENSSYRIPNTGSFVQGRADVDPGSDLERGVDMPWAGDPAGSYLYYDCSIGVMLDSGIVVHNRLPQLDNTPDTLSYTSMDSPDLDQVTNKGVNLKSNDKFIDIVQRMGHSRYWFRIWGQALRIGYKVPIPGIKSIGGIVAIPHDDNPQWAFNTICPGGNYGGIPLWRAQWSLWYTVATPPVSDTIPTANASAHIGSSTTLPDGVQVPFSQADSNAKPTQPPGFATTGKVRG